MADDDVEAERRREDLLAVQRAQEVVRRIDRTLERSREVAREVLPKLRQAGRVR